MSDDSKTAEDQQQIIMTYKGMLSESQSIAQKIGELDAERNEHGLVINAIKDLDPNRRCFRLIGGVLVERTIKEVLPAVQKNYEGIGELIAQLHNQLKLKQTALNEFQAKHNIGVKQAQSTSQDSSQISLRSGGSTGGVLV